MSIDGSNATIERAISRRSAIVYVALSSGLAGSFLLAATLVGSYGLVSRIGGAVWVFLLSMIVTMPLVTSWVKRRTGEE